MKVNTDEVKDIVPTGLDICGSGIVFREVRKVWKRATKAELRLEMLKNLGVKNLGLETVERNVRQESNKRHPLKFQSTRK